MHVEKEKKLKRTQRSEHPGNNIDQIRLNKFISSTGFCSRREADKLIEQGRVTVNGTKAEMGTKVSSVDKELAGQVAANFETATKVPMKDRRVFQDGIFIINKAGREM